MEAELRSEILSDTLSRAVSAGVAFTVVAIIAIVTGMFGDEYTTIIRTLGVSIIAINVLRVWVAKVSRHSPHIEKHWRAFQVITAVNGLMWGLLLSAAILDDQGAHWGLLLTFTIYTAFCNASIFTLANSLRLHAGFLLGISLPIACVMLKMYLESQHNFHIAVMCFIGVIILYTLSQGRAVRKIFIQKFETSLALINSQKALIEQRAMIEHVNRLSSIGEMAAGFAHEINNPLAIVIGNLEILEAELGDKNLLDAPINRIITKTIGSATRIARIIRGLRTLSRAGSKEGRTPNTLESILEDTLVLFDQRIVTHNIKMTVDNQVTDTISCDPIQIGQVLVNLLGNACDEIATHDAQAQHEIVLKARRAENWILIEVTNSGPAMSDEVRDKIFTPFFTTKPVGQGMGLGLVISRSIAVQHEGSLELDTTTGKTRFTLKLPC